MSGSSSRGAGHDRRSRDADHIFNPQADPIEAARSFLWMAGLNMAESRVRSFT